MSEHVYFITIALPAATILIVFGMRYNSKIQEAKARLANDGAYRQLAETATAAQSQTATSLATMETTLSDVRARLAAIETVLKAVE